MYGVNLSGASGEVDHTTLSQGLWGSYAWIKATEGGRRWSAGKDKGYLSPACQVLAEGMQSTSTPFGYFHYATPKISDAENEAEWFLEARRTLPVDTMCPALDLEQGDDELSDKQLSEWCQRWIGVVTGELGYPIVLYCNSNYTRKLLSGYDLEEADLWIAHYKPIGEDQLPAPGAEPTIHGAVWDDYTVWQYTSKGYIAGVEKRVCLNVAPRGIDHLLRNQDPRRVTLLDWRGEIVISVHFPSPATVQLLVLDGYDPRARLIEVSRAEFLAGLTHCDFEEVLA